MQISDTCILVIRHLIESRNDNDKTQYYSDLAVHIPDSDSTDVYLLPNILLWDPFNQIPNCPKLNCPHCKSDGNENVNLYPLITPQWELGQYNNRIPRKIWDKAWYCALVGKLYGCKGHHQLVSYHAGILEQLPSYQIPFILSHGSGMTTSMFDSILRLVDEGNNFCKVESILGEWVRETFNQRKLLNANIEFPIIENVFKTIAPSDNFIRKCYISNYEQNSWKYYKELEKIDCETVSCDLTFQSSTKIGFRHEKKWVTLYDSVYIIMNGRGLVKFYIFSNGTHFDSVYDTFRTSKVQLSNVRIIYLHDCCNWREKLVNLFPDVEVKLNLQHAINFLKENLSKKNSHYFDVCSDIDLIFRADNDYGKERTLFTPSPAEIMKNIDSFLEKWGTSGLTVVLKEQFFIALKKLNEHIIRGCMSDIPPNHCLKLPSLLSRQVKNVLNTISLGVQTAHALINSVIYFHNRKSLGETVVSPVWSLDEYHLLPKKDQKNLAQMTKKSALTGEESVNNAGALFLKNVGMTLIGTDEVSKIDHGYSIPQIVVVIKKVVNLSRILFKIDSKMDKALSERLYRHQEFCTLPTEIWAPTSYLRLCRLTNVVDRECFIPFLQTIGLYELFDSQDSGVDSFLASISLSLLNLIKCGNLPDQYVEALRESGIKGNGKVTDTSYALIPVLHNELINGQREIYEVVLSGDDLGKQAENMLKGAKISTSLRDTLPLVVANALNLMVIIIPMSEGLPLLPVFPENAMVIDDPLILLFENSENGRYTAINFDDEPEQESVSIKARCRCGANDKKVKKRCGAGIRCSCRANKTTCSSKCGCVGCTNNKPKKIYKKKRKRFHESLSQVSTVKSYDAAYQYGETITGTPINTANHFLLEANLFVFLGETKTVLKNLDDEFVTENMFSRYLEMRSMLSELDDNRNKHFVNKISDQIDKETVSRWVRLRKKKENLVIEFNSTCALEEVTICNEEPNS